MLADQQRVAPLVQGAVVSGRGNWPTPLSLVHPTFFRPAQTQTGLEFPASRKPGRQFLPQPTTISTTQWSLGPQRSGSLRARTVTEDARLLDANTKSSWRVAVSGVCRVE